MRLFKILNSPLAGTAGVLVALGALAIPLRQLTSAGPPPQSRVAAAQVSAANDSTPVLLRLKLLTPARSIRINTEDGKTQLDLTNLAAGESEHDVALPLADGRLDLMLEADLGDGPSDTAVFLTVMPDAREEQTRFIIGRGTLAEPLRYDWHQH
jgi:hypothetical protein